MYFIRFDSFQRRTSLNKNNILTFSMRLGTALEAFSDHYTHILVYV